MLAQGKSAGLITRRSLDRNQDMLSAFFFLLFSPPVCVNPNGNIVLYRSAVETSFFIPSGPIATRFTPC
ncbi:hypothetical protein BJX62DRAFT_210651 [Aspergillus germanicus]